MLKEGRPGLTEEQKADMWRRWKTGYSIREICQALKRNSSPVHAQLAIRGGIAPPGRIRAVVLKLPEREEISRGLGAGESVRSIARRLARAASTVSREIVRHGGRASYRGRRQCAIVTAAIAGRTGGEIVQELATRGINTSASLREYGILDFDAKGVDSVVRISPHYYNTREEIDRLADAITELSIQSR